MEEIENFAERLREVLDESDEKENTDESDLVGEGGERPPSSLARPITATAVAVPSTGSGSKKRAFAGDELPNSSSSESNSEACSSGNQPTASATDEEKYKPEVY